MKTFQIIILSSILLTLFSCKKEKTVITDNSVNIKRQLFIPKPGWNGKLKSISFYSQLSTINGTATDYIKGFTNQYYYLNGKIIAHSINSSPLPDSSILTYDSSAIKINSIYDNGSNNDYYTEYYRYNTTTNNLVSSHMELKNIYIEPPMSNSIDTIQYIGNAISILKYNLIYNDGSGFFPINYTTSVLERTEDSLLLNTHVIERNGNFYDIDEHIYYSSINNPELLSIINDMFYLFRPNNDITKRIFSYNFPFISAETGYNTIQMLDKIPLETYYKTTTNNSFFVLKDEFSYHFTGTKISSIVKSKYGVVNTPFSFGSRDSIVFTYY